MANTSKKHNQSNQEDIGGRLLFLRKSFRFSRKYFQENHELPAITLQKWEISERRLSDQAIDKIIEIYRSENIEVTKDWLLYGLGEKPRYIFKSNPVEGFAEIDFTQNDELKISREIKFFEKQHKNAKVIIVEDEDMSPLYKAGDYVGGIGISGDAKHKIDNLDCIVLTKRKSNYALRRVHCGNGNKFRLSILNSDSKNPQPVVYNASLAFVAPVIWVRRPNNFQQT